MRSMRLKARSRIGMKMLGLVYPKAVKRSRVGVGNPRKIASIFSFQRMKCSLRIFLRALFQNKIDMLRFWRPHPEMRFLWSDQFGADWITTFYGSSHATFSPTGAAPVVHGSNFAFHRKIEPGLSGAADHYF